MSIVTIKNKYQIVIPAKLRKEVGLNVGDFLEAGYEDGKVVLTPKSLLDRELAMSLADIRAGRTYGPFTTADELIASLRKNVKRVRQEKKRG